MQAKIATPASIEDSGAPHAKIGARIRQLRKAKELSQGSVQQMTGLLRCYISRIENGHTVPSLETLERLASALGVPLYRLFYEGDGMPQPLLSSGLRREGLANAEEAVGPHARFLRRLGRICRGMADSDRRAVLVLAKKMSDRHEEISGSSAKSSELVRADLTTSVVTLPSRP